MGARDAGRRNAAGKRRMMHILRTIHEKERARSFPPTIRELAVAVGLESTSTVDRWVAILELEGLIWREAYRARRLRVTDAGRAALALFFSPIGCKIDAMLEAAGVTPAQQVPA